VNFICDSAYDTHCLSKPSASDNSLFGCFIARCIRYRKVLHTHEACIYLTKGSILVRNNNQSGKNARLHRFILHCGHLFLTFAPFHFALNSQHVNGQAEPGGPKFEILILFSSVFLLVPSPFLLSSLLQVQRPWISVDITCESPHEILSIFSLRK
jgi:hypothetical protein